MKRFIILIIIALMGISSFAQVSKKEAQEKKIKSVAEWETNLKNRKAKPIQESYTKYDQGGNILDLIERDNNGEVTLYEKYEYDVSGNKTIELQLNPDGSVNKKHMYIYDKNLRIGRKTYNSNDQLIAEKKYIYEFYTK